MFYDFLICVDVLAGMVIERFPNSVELDLSRCFVQASTGDVSFDDCRIYIDPTATVPLDLVRLRSSLGESNCPCDNDNTFEPINATGSGPAFDQRSAAGGWYFYLFLLTSPFPPERLSLR